MRHHAATHLAPGLHRVALGQESLRLGGLLDRLVQLSEVADDLLAEAIGADGDRRLAVAAIRESRELVAMISKLTGADSAEVVKDAERLVRALARVLPLHLEAATALASELGNGGSTELATAMSPGQSPATGPGERLRGLGGISRADVESTQR